MESNEIKECPCFIDKPLYQYNGVCKIENYRTEQNPIPMCRDIQECFIKRLTQQLKESERQLETVMNSNKLIQRAIQVAINLTKHTKSNQ